jgi:beta-glucanase (GH16 family)
MMDRVIAWLRRLQLVIATAALIIAWPATAGNDDGERISSANHAAGPDAPPATAASAGWRLVFADEFGTAGAPNASRWRHKITDHWQPAPELQTYTTDPANAQVMDGRLLLTALADGAGGWTSARLHSHDFFHYGRFEARIAVPQGIGAWAAFWLLGDDSALGWPACGEVDIMEAPAAERGRVFAGTHQPGSSGAPVGSKDLVPPTLLADPTGWHVYAVDWQPGRMDFYVDGVLTGAVTRQAIETAGGIWVFDTQPQQIILNLAIGGWGGVPGPWAEQVMAVDWVRVWSPE